MLEGAIAVVLEVLQERATEEKGKGQEREAKYHVPVVPTSAAFLSW